MQWLIICSLFLKTNVTYADHMAVSLYLFSMLFLVAESLNFSLNPRSVFYSQATFFLSSLYQNNPLCQLHVNWTAMIVDMVLNYVVLYVVFTVLFNFQCKSEKGTIGGRE